MRLMALLAAGACSLGGPCVQPEPGGQPQPSAPTLDGLAFLAGAWEAEDEGERMREVWDMPRGDAMGTSHSTLPRTLSFQKLPSASQANFVALVSVS